MLKRDKSKSSSLRVDHPYYCTALAFHVPGTTEVERFETWKDFSDEWGAYDLDLSLLFRWDWQPADDPEDVEDGDEVRGEHLDLFYLLQRKGLFLSVTVDVTLDDEPAIREWLAARWEHLRKTWAPISGAEGEPWPA